MDGSEREAFLADVHVGIVSITQPQRAPLAVPVWYFYEPGGLLTVITPADSRKARCLNEAGRFSLCAQSEVPMYKYVSVEGSIVAVDAPVDPDERRALARRYLGQEGGDLFIEATAEDAVNEVAFRMKPERWLSADFNKALQ
jgi:nitroimidazol reductase NimA-like FMN-containing flavoprotein (pyridoxamine 5'-phosphate oxidase superfamily)